MLQIERRRSRTTHLSRGYTFESTVLFPNTLVIEEHLSFLVLDVSAEQITISLFVVSCFTLDVDRS